MRSGMGMGAAWVAMALSLLAATGATGGERKSLATVDGVAVYEDDLRLAETELGEELAQLDELQRRALLLRYVINTRLLARAAIDEAVDKGEDFQRRLEYYRLQALRDAYVEKTVDAAVDDAALRAIYERDYAAAPAEEEVHARHILLKSEDEAKAVIARLKSGEDFVAVAKNVSVGPSGELGGDLGWFGRGQMAKGFEDAAFALQPGQLSPPVQSQFGWHVIRVEERRQRSVPAFEAVREQIRAPLMQQKAREMIDSLRGKSKVDVPDPALARAIGELD